MWSQSFVSSPCVPAVWCDFVCVCACMCLHVRASVCVSVQCICACVHSYVWVQACRLENHPECGSSPSTLVETRSLLLPAVCSTLAGLYLQALAYGFPSQPNTCACPFGTSTFCWFLEIFSQSWGQWVKPEAHPAFPSCAVQSTPLLFGKTSNLKKYLGSGHCGKQMHSSSRRLLLLWHSGLLSLTLTSAFSISSYCSVLTISNDGFSKTISFKYMSCTLTGDAIGDHPM